MGFYLILFLMGLALEIMEGAHQGRIYPIRDGHVMGRTTGEIRIKDDPRISSVHAKVQKDPRGGLLLVDEKSANGLQINGVAVRRIKLLPGVQFIAGKTRFRVVEAEIEAPESAPELKEPEKKWADRLTEGLAGLELGAHTAANHFGAFSPILHLTFLEGLQADQEVTIGFGPRNFGSDTLDVELHDPLSPPLAFTINPTPDGPELVTQYPKLVRVNGKHDNRCLLVNGDRIQVGHTLIEIRFIV